MNNVKKQIVIVLCGPTAVGKTETALAIATALNCQVVSADSMQVYQGMDIGTAKPSLEQQGQVKHHLVDIIEPKDRFTVADFVRLAAASIQDISRAGALPLVAGGTGLYINALIDGFLFPQQGAAAAVRAELQKQAATDPDSLYQELTLVDPVSAAKLHPNDTRRIIRALEVFRTQGVPISQLQARAKANEGKYHPIMIGLTCRRDLLYQRIEKRVDQMAHAGLVDEVQALLQKYPHQPTALQAIGYKEIALHLSGHLSLDEAIALLKRETRRYAKRQLSWFRRDQRIVWYDRTHTDREQIILDLRSSLKKATD